MCLGSWVFALFGSAQHLPDHIAVHVGQSMVPTLVLERQFGVVDPQAMKDRGM